LFADLRQSISDWIFRASVPEASPVTLVQRRIFILPTRQGYTFAFTVMVLLVASINYALSLGFVLTFTLVSMAGVAMLHTWRNLAHLKLRPGRCDPVFAGDIGPSFRRTYTVMGDAVNLIYEFCGIIY